MFGVCEKLFGRIFKGACQEPKSVVKVKSQRLFVLAKDSLYNIRHLKSQLRYSLDI